MTIRAATTDDCTAIRRVARAAWREDYPGVLSRETAEAGVEEWYDDDRLTTEIERDDGVVLVARRDAEIVGFAHAVVTEGRGTVLRVYVHPDARRTGLGGDLLETTLDELAAAGADTIEAMVLAENDLGRGFYEAVGFERVGEGETTIAGESYRECVYRLVDA
jgi:ribosomal protein S18 acetylase RimI-like enzyme